MVEKSELELSERYGAFAAVYDRLMADVPYGEWLGWLDLYWKMNGRRPSAVADLGCGTGTLAIPLAQSGQHVIGVDLSEEMLAVARRKEAAVRSELQIAGTLEWKQCDMRDWELPEPVESVISFCDCLNYITEEDDLRRTFRRTYEALTDGGTFLFDMHHPKQLDEYLQNEPFCQDDEEVSYIWTCTEDEIPDTVIHRLVFFLRGESEDCYTRKVETHKQRMYSVETVHSLLREAGFKEIEAYSDFSFEPIDDQSTLRMFFAAVR